MTLYIHRTSISQRYWFVVEIEGGGGGGGSQRIPKNFQERLRREDRKERTKMCRDESRNNKYV